MRIIIILSILLYSSEVSYARNDTIYLYENYLELNGYKYNKIENEIRIGKWIEFTIEDNTIDVRLSSGDNAHWHDNIYYEYRPVKQGEYCRIEIKTSGKVIGEIDEDTIYGRNYVKIINKIPPDKYNISGKGKYKNNKKQGKWTYFHLNQRLKKEINYNNGLPKKGFIVFRPDETIMLEFIKMNKDEWKIIKYSESGKKLDQDIKKTNEIKTIF